MNGPWGCHTQWSKSDREITYDISYMWNLNIMNEITYKTERDSSLKKWPHGCWGKGTVRDFGKVVYTLLHLKWVTNKDLLYSTGNSAQCSLAAWMEGSLGESGCMHMYVWVPVLSTWNYHIIVNWLCVCVLSCFSSVWLYRTLWAIVFHAPLSMGFSRQESWSGLLCPPPGDLPDPGIEPRSPKFFTIWADTEAQKATILQWKKISYGKPK